MEPLSLAILLGLTGLFPAPPPGEWQEPAPFPGPQAPMASRDPDEEEMEIPRPRFMLGLFDFYATVGGHLEKENTPAGIGSGGDAVSLQSDLDMDRWSHVAGFEFGIYPQGRNIRLRGAVQGGTMRGNAVLGQGFRHEGRIYPTGDLVRSKLSMLLADAEIHFLPRQERRTGEFGLFFGVRAFQFVSVLEGAIAGRTSERSAGGYPRFGLQGWIPLGAGMMIFGAGGLGGWAWGDSHDYYAFADAEAQGGLGYIVRVGLLKVDLRVGYRYMTMGVYRENDDDKERVSFERGGLFAGAKVVF